MTYVHLDWFSENVDLAHATAKEKGMKMTPTLVALTVFCAKTAYRTGTIPLTQIELAEKVGNSPTSMPPLMQQLVDLGILFKATDKRYALGSWWNHMNYDQDVQFRNNDAPWVERPKGGVERKPKAAEPSALPPKALAAASDVGKFRWELQSATPYPLDEKRRKTLKFALHGSEGLIGINEKNEMYTRVAPLPKALERALEANGVLIFNPDDNPTGGKQDAL